MIAIKLDLVPIKVNDAEWPLIDFIQWLNNTSPVFNANGPAIKQSIRLQSIIDAAKHNGLKLLRVPNDLHSALIQAAQSGPYPIKPARSLQPYISEIVDPIAEQPKLEAPANGSESVR